MQEIGGLDTHACFVAGAVRAGDARGSIKSTGLYIPTRHGVPVHDRTAIPMSKAAGGVNGMGQKGQDYDGRGGPEQNSVWVLLNGKKYGVLFIWGLLQ